MKNVIITIVVAGAVGLVGPHNLHEAAALTMRVGIVILRLGLLLDRSGSDADWAEPHDEDGPQLQEARETRRSRLRARG